MKKSNQKSLGENPETPDAPVRPDRKVYDLPDLGLDDAYKVFILIRFLLHPNQMRRRHLESVSAALYGSTFQLPLKSPIRIQPQLKRKGVLGHSPKRVLVWGPRRDARPAGERRSGEALEGCLSHRDSDPIWSKARDDAHE